MTFSLNALDRETGMFGIAVASSSIAVGNRCPWARAGAGAVSTQHRTDIRCGPLGLDLLAQGFTASEVVALLVAGSDQPDLRQFAAVDREGGTAFFNGPGIESINTAHQGDACVSVGNFMVNETVTAEMIRGYEASGASLFAERLLDGLDAGVTAGGETQPAMAAALLIVDRHAWPLVDLRVDFELNPATKLRKLWTAYEPLVERFITQVLRPAELKPLINSALQV
ncbi:Uncharacterized conserved protein, Ntn-hydrolase superfamily [Faunimonas pinastri]|uniref:Uncharacterized conserved protein, Ntn-hydrolase superfamily n=1 Tax=Faunimonas pinastri TaxID=1855383 RepID=A0A1H9C0T8_9HYPH|nr:DUF1028 domain-containing protein [Faunimonas pinastri]SEP94860.1 Uncharacterized conserved protein, Ntn-hydrolase superfamily [Faunimonas pinastri]